MISKVTNSSFITVVFTMALMNLLSFSPVTFVESFQQPSTNSVSPSSALNYLTPEQSSNKFITNTVRRKPVIANIHNLEEMLSFVDDDRFVVVKFYAQWCKVCKRLGADYSRLASKVGDGILELGQSEPEKVLQQGSIKFGEIAYSPDSKDLIQSLGVIGVPTMAVYWKKHKVFQASSQTNTRMLEAELERLEHFSPEKLEARFTRYDNSILNASGALYL